MVKIVTEYITLGQLLKKLGMAGTGGQAKVIIDQSNIKVNGEREQRRGRKLYVGDVIDIDGDIHRITR